MATLDRVDHELASRIIWLIKENPGLSVSEGYRPHAEQVQRWNAYQAYRAAVATYGNKWNEHATWAATAAKPGTSDHEKDPALAVDVAWAGGVPSHPGPRLAPKYGMETKVPGEPWHMTLRAGSRPAVPNIEMPTTEEAKQMGANFVGFAPTPSGKGYWLVTDDGGVFSFGDAQYKGGANQMKLNAPVRGMHASPTGGGYWLFAEDGGVFAYGDAESFGSPAT